MKKLLTLVVVMTFCIFSYGQNNTINTNVTAQQLANTLLGNGVDLISATYSGNSASKGIFKTNAIPQMDEGIILSTGQVNKDIFLPPTNFNSHSLNGAGDGDLLSLFNSVGYDAASLEVVIRPRGTKLSFQYIFASEEYPAYVCQANDMFGLLIKPNTANSTYQNIAIVPGTNYPISINTINHYATPCSGYPQSYNQYYQTPNNADSFVFNGRTVLLSAEFNVTPCQEYRLKFVIHDQMDDGYNSAIYIKANSLNSTGVTINFNQANVLNGVKDMIRNCEKDTIKVVRNSGIVGDIDINIAKSGTAVQGVDYIAIVDSFKLLNAQQQYNIPIVPIGNSNIDKQLVLKFYRKFPNCSNGVDLLFIDSIVYNFKNLTKPTNLTNITLCNNNNYQLNISNSNNYDSIQISPNVGLNNYKIFNPIFSGANTQTFYVKLFKNGCNRLDTFTIYRQGALNKNISDSICASNLPYNWKGKIVNSVGTHILKDTTLTAQGCDSITTLTLKVFPNPTNPSLNQTICQQTLPFVWNGQTINSVGNHTLTFTKKSVVSNCDSTTTLNLTVNPTKSHSINQTICQENLPFLWNGLTVNSVGTHTLNYTKASVLTGCDSTTTLTLTVNPKKSHSISQTICQQSLPFNWNGSTVNSVGNYTLYYTTPSVVTGCDSTTTLSLTVNPTKTATINTTICQNSLPYNWNGQIVNAIGNHILTYTIASAITGCDSVTTLNLIVNGNTTHAITQTICQQQLPYNWNGQTVNAIGTFNLTYTTASILTGCDSTTKLTLTVNPTKTHSISQTICQQNLPYVWNGLTVNTVGNHTLNYTKPSVLTGCDSITTLTLTVNPTKTHAAYDTICQSALPYVWNGLTVNTVGTHTLTYTKASMLTGCDSITTLNLIVRPNPIVNLGADQNSCVNVGWNYTLNAGNVGVSYLWNTQDTTQNISINQNGTYYVGVTNSFGCTSYDTVLINFRTNPVINLTPDTNLCDGDSILLDATYANAAVYNWNTGAITPSIVVKTGGNYVVNVLGQNGCSSKDSTLVTLRQNPEVDLGPDVNTCINIGDLHFINAGNPGLNYLWDNNYNGQVRVVNATGQYWVKVSNMWQCFDIDTINVTLKPNPEVNLGNDTNICEDGHIILDAGNNGVAYYWNTGGTNQQNKVTLGGTYFVAVTGSNGCVGGDTITISQSGKMPKFDNIWITNEASHRFKFSVLNPQYIIGYYWDFGDGSAPAYSSNPEHTYPAHGNYIVTLHASSTCGIFTDTSTVHIYTTGIDDYNVANALIEMYPNPSSDYVTITMKDQSAMEKVTILNAIGQVVYQSSVQNQHQMIIHVGKLPSGTYQLNVTTPKGVIHKKMIVAH